MQVRGSFRKLVFSAFVMGSAGALAGCVVQSPGYRDDGYRDSRSYPPARPYDGYRYAYPGGLTLIFDSGLGLYSIYGYPDYYFSDGYFYRWQSGYWNRSRRWNDRWERCESRAWPRPIYYVNNNYYVHGRRPQFDWNREGQPNRRDDDRRHDDDRDRQPGNRRDGDRRGDDRGDFRGQPHSGGLPPVSPGMRTGGDDDHGPGMRDGGDPQTRDGGDDSRGQRRLDARREDEQRRALEQAQQRQAADAGRDQQRAAQQAEREQQRAAEQAEREQRRTAEQQAHDQRRAAEQAQREQRRTAEQNARAQGHGNRDGDHPSNRSGDDNGQDDRNTRGDGDRWNDWRNQH